MIYEITDPLVSTKPVDEIDVEQLTPEDKIGKYVFCRLVPVSNELDASAGDHKQDIGIPKEFRPIPDGAVLMCFVASIMVDRKFKVYMNFGERVDITNTQWTYEHGPKLRDEKLARKLFPMLNEYEFVVN